VLWRVASMYRRSASRANQRLTVVATASKLRRPASRSDTAIINNYRIESLEWRQMRMQFGRVYDGSDGVNNNLRLIQVNLMSAGRNHDLPAVC